MTKNNIVKDTEYGYQYYENGNLKRKYPLKDTIGLDTEYYENGNIKSTMEFDGKTEKWNTTSDHCVVMYHKV